MRKFKVIKKWPGGPEVGKTLEAAYGRCDRVDIMEDSTKLVTVHVDDLVGFAVEQVPRGGQNFYFMDENGDICSGHDGYEDEDGPDWKSPIPNYLRFKTKESVETFKKFMVDSLGTTTMDSFWEVEDMIRALNCRCADENK